MNEAKKRLLLVDTPSYFYRAFHAIRELRSPSGEPTNGGGPRSGGPSDGDVVDAEFKDADDRKS